MGCYIWYSSKHGPGRAGAPLSPFLAVPNVTAHPSTVSVPITVLLYDGPLLCDFNVDIKGLWDIYFEATAAIKPKLQYTGIFSEENRNSIPEWDGDVNENPQAYCSERE